MVNDKPKHMAEDAGEAGLLLLKEWHAAGLLPSAEANGGKTRHAWFHDVLQALRRAYKDEQPDWAKAYLKGLHLAMC